MTFLFESESINQTFRVQYVQDICRVSTKILEFIGLPPGWHYGEGIGSSTTTASTALKLSTVLEGIGAGRINAFPEVDGSILVNSDLDGVYHEFRCIPDGAILVAEGEDSDEQEYTFSEIIKALGDKPWKPSHVWSTQSTTTSSVDGLYPRRSADQDQMMQSRLFA